MILKVEDGLKLSFLKIIKGKLINLCYHNQGVDYMVLAKEVEVIHYYY
jgi:hypothetical protein